jgi:NADH-quinone oxidoreductase subunit E
VNDKVKDIIEKYNGEKSAIVSILQDLQAEYNYLPRKELQEISEELKIPLSQIYSLATFYRAFSLKQRGKHQVCLCMGTACHVRGSVRILEELKRELGVEAGQTSKDNKFTLETVNCLGACALGPLMTVDGQYFGRMSSKKVNQVVKKYKK